MDRESIIYGFWSGVPAFMFLLLFSVPAVARQGEADTDTILMPAASLHRLRHSASDSLKIDSLIREERNRDTLQIMKADAYERNSLSQKEGTDTLLSLTPSVKENSYPQTNWVPNPATATWLALVFPGAGQIYNRKYWKLPIIYGGFVGCLYALNWNGQMYSDYRQAYQDIMDSDSNTASYLDFLPPTYDVEAHEEYLKRLFKSRKDRYRRYRDLSVFCFIGVYIVSVIDAYVDAELSVFDISKDLGIRISPGVIENRYQNTQCYGVHCSINF